MATVTIFDAPYPLVSLDEAKVALGESGNDRNTLISGLIMAAQSEMDGPKGWLGMSVAEQGIEYVADSFDDTITLPYGPIVGDPIVYYLDADGVEQIVDDSTYQVLADGSLSLLSEQEWPATLDQSAAVRIRYYVGIEDAFDPRIDQLKTAIIMHVRMTLDMVAPEAHRRAIESLVRSLWVARC